MSLNVAMQLYRGSKANLSVLASTGNTGVLVWTTDTHELYVDNGSGNAGIGSGNAWQRVASDASVFTANSQTIQTALSNVLIGDFCTRTDNNLTYILTAEPASTFTNWTPIAVTSVSGTSIQGLSGPTTNEWVTYIDINGVQHLSQPVFANIGGTLANTQLPAHIGSGSSLVTFDCGTF